MTFEQWIAEKDPLAIMALMAVFGDESVLIQAHAEGVRQSEDRDMQKILDGIDRIASFKDEPWFEESAEKLAADDLKGAAEILVRNGVHKAPCCDGTNPNCEVQNAINHVLAQLN
jgi:hypothetical protein